MFRGLGGTLRVGIGLVSSIFGWDFLVSAGNLLKAVAGLGDSGLEAFAEVKRVVVEANRFLAAALLVVLKSRMQKTPLIVITKGTKWEKSVH